MEIYAQTALDKMVPEVKERWLSALESGQYLQTSEALTGLAHSDADGNPVPHDLLEERVGYCCLGVLCEVMGWEFDDDEGGTNSGPVQLVGTNSGKETSPDAPGWVGTASGLTLRTREELARLNDNGANFRQIADVIRKHL